MSEVTQDAWDSRVMTAFKTYWDTVHPGVQIASPNRDFEPAKIPADVKTYLEWADVGLDQTRYSHSVARNHFSRTGVFTFTAHVRLGEKLKLATDLVETCGRFFETVVIADGYFQKVGVPLDLGHDGAWHQVSISGNWLYFTDRPSTLTG